MRIADITPATLRTSCIADWRAGETVHAITDRDMANGVAGMPIVRLTRSSWVPVLPVARVTR